MSIAAVIELSHELRRLAIAGVGLAPGDRRIAEIVPTLSKSGETVPVFATLAERSEALLGASKRTAAAEFLRLNTLVGAVLNSQLRTGLDGEIVPLPAPSMTSRPISARLLEELRSSVHGGRIDALRDALERGHFGDIRLAGLAVDTLEADHAELANLAAERLIPPYGAGIVPLLLERLDLALKRPASRLLEAIGRADPDTGTRLARRILDPDATPDPDAGAALVVPEPSGPPSDEAVAAALGLLGDGDGDRALLKARLHAKRKPVRVAALRRLLTLGDVAAEAHCLTLLGGPLGKAREALESMPALSDAESSAAALALARELANKLRESDVTTAEANTLSVLLSLLVRSDADPGRFDVAFAIADDLGKLRTSASAFEERTVPELIEYLIAASPEHRQRDVARLVTGLSASHAVLGAIRRLGPPAAFGFLGLAEPRTLLGAIRRLGKPAASERHRHLESRKLLHGLEAIFREGWGAPSLREAGLPPPAAWNVEWLELGLRAEQIGLVAYLWPLDPAGVVGSVLGNRVIRRHELAMLALLADPACAGTLRGRLDAEAPDHALFTSLCDAIERGEEREYLALATKIPDRHGRALGAALRARLTEHAASRKPA